KRAHHDGEFPGAGDAQNIHLFRIGAAACEGIERAGQQAVRNEAVEPADHDGKPESVRLQIAVESLVCVLAHRPRNTAFRFSRKALAPSRRSSDAAVTPKAMASNRRPASRPPSSPASTASIANATARGP